jgi:hypothetical protein
MANFTHFTRGSAVSMTQHFERKKNENGEYLKYKNQQIDTSRSHLNYNLAPERNQLEFIKNRTEELKCLRRKNVNVMASWIVTAPKELPKEREREFFEESYKFLENKYGKKNVISAWVHMDENQPHLHFAFVPVVYDKKKEREKVSCKECVTKFDLQKFHGELQAYLDEWQERKGYDFDCMVLNGATAGGNMTIQELKAKSLANDIDEMEKEYEATIEKTDEAFHEYVATTVKTEESQKEHESLKQTISDLQTDISALEDKKAEIDDEISQKKSEVSELQAQINERSEELRIVDGAIKEKMERGVELFSADNMAERLQAERSRREKEKRIELLERFIELPQIKPLWIKFSSFFDRNKPDRGHNRPPKGRE